MEIQSTVAIVTGGASGLGRATALRLGRGGARVVVADLNEEAGQQVASELGDNGAFVRVDVTSEDDVNAALDVAAERFGGGNAAINCAGIAVAKGAISGSQAGTGMNTSAADSISPSPSVPTAMTVASRACTCLMLLHILS